jgi:hypothetical protein
MNNEEITRLERKSLEVNVARNAIGLPDIKILKRNCLKCDKSFISRTVGNRICDYCKDKITHVSND